MPGIDKFKHAILFPAPLPQPSEKIDLSQQHREEMKKKYYGKKPIRKYVEANAVFKQQYGDEMLPMWQSITRSDYTNNGFASFKANVNNAAVELKSTHFRIEDPSISRPADARDASSITQSDFVPYPEARREKLHKSIPQPYPVIYRDPDIKPETTSLYKSDFDSKLVREKLHNLAADRANMRATHFSFGGDERPDRYVSASHYYEVKNLSPEQFKEITSSERRNAIKSEQSKRSNVLEFVDLEKPEWKSVQKSEYVDMSKEADMTTKHEINEDLRAIHFKLGQEDHYDDNDVSTYSTAFKKHDPTEKEKRKIVKPPRPGSTEGIQIEWRDLPTTQNKSETASEFKGHIAGHDARDFAQSIKQYASKTSIKFAHSEEDSEDRFSSLTKAHYGKPNASKTTASRHFKAPPSHQLWDPEEGLDQGSVSKSDYMDPLLLDPERKTHFIQGKLDLEKSSAILRMTNFNLGSEDGAKKSSYTETFVEKQMNEPRIVHKKKYESVSESDRIIARYPDAVPRTSAYKDTYKELPLPTERADRYAHKAVDAGLTLHQLGVDMNTQKESVTRQDYVLPEIMVDRSVTWRS